MTGDGMYEVPNKRRSGFSQFYLVNSDGHVNSVVVRVEIFQSYQRNCRRNRRIKWDIYACEMTSHWSRE